MSSVFEVPQMDQDPCVKVITPNGGKTMNITKGFNLSNVDNNKLSSVVTSPRSQSPLLERESSTNTQSISNQSSNDDGRRIKSNETDMNLRYKTERSNMKEHLYMVVIGHVDAGKSTLMGHLLYALGQVTSIRIGCRHTRCLFYNRLIKGLCINMNRRVENWVNRVLCMHGFLMRQVKNVIGELLWILEGINLKQITNW